MDRRTALKGTAAMLAASRLGWSESSDGEPPASRDPMYDLSVPEEALHALVKMRGDLAGGEVARYWTG